MGLGGRPRRRLVCFITMLLGRASSMMSGAAAQRVMTRSMVPVKECRRYASGGHGPSYNEPSGTHSICR